HLWLARWMAATPGRSSGPKGYVRRREKRLGVPTGAWQTAPVLPRGGMDFSNPDFVLTARMTSINDGVSRYQHSTDRGHSWEGPCRLPAFGQPQLPPVATIRVMSSWT